MLMLKFHLMFIFKYKIIMHIIFPNTQHSHTLTNGLLLMYNLARRQFIRVAYSHILIHLRGAFHGRFSPPLRG